MKTLSSIVTKVFLSTLFLLISAGLAFASAGCSSWGRNISMSKGLTVTGSVSGFAEGDVLTITFNNGNASNIVKIIAQGSSSIAQWPGILPRSVSYTVLASDVGSAISYELFGGANNNWAANLSCVADTSAPTVTFSPADGATDVTSSSNVKLIFNEAIRKIDDSALTDDNVDALISLKDTDENGSDIAFDATISGNVITINPTSDFNSNQKVYVAIGSTVEDLGDNPIVATNATFTAISSAAVSNSQNAKATEVNDEIGSKIKSNAKKQMRSFETATTAVVSAARGRAVSKRSSRDSASRSTSSGAAGGGNGDQTEKANTGVSEAENELNIRISSKDANSQGAFGSVFRAYGSNLTRYSETQVGYSKSGSNRETLNISSQIIYEHEKSDDLTLGYFVGFSLGKDTSNDTMKVDIESIGVQFGSYFVRNITQNIFVDGYVAGSKLFNRMEAVTSTMTAEADYASYMGATGLAITGSANASRWEILPTLAIDYAAVSSENAKFVVTSGAGNASELFNPGNPRQLGITFSSEFRTPFDYYDGYWSQGSTFSFKPHVTCQRVYENGVKLSDECGRGAAFNISSQDANATKTLSFTAAVNELAGDSTISLNFLYKAEF